MCRKYSNERTASGFEETIGAGLERLTALFRAPNVQPGKK
jgi:hypothetical protein